MLEFIYAVFILSGFIKGVLKAFSFYLPFDLTLLSAVTIVGYLLTQLSYLRTSSRCFLIFLYILVAISWLLFSSIYTVSHTFWLIKAAKLFTNVVAFMVPLLYLRFNVKRFIYLFVFVSSVFSAIFCFFVLPYAHLYEGFGEFSFLYLTQGFLSGLNIILVIIYLRYYSLGSKVESLFLFSFFLLSIVTLLYSSARGPMLFTALVIIMFLLTLILRDFYLGKLSRKNYTLLKWFLATGFLASVFVIYIGYSEPLLVKRTLHRLTSLFSFFEGKAVDASALGRIVRWEYTFEALSKDFDSLLLGYGLGSFGIKFFGEDIREYPHNLFLEVWFEGGLVGLLLFLVLFLWVFILSYRSPFFWAYLYAFLNFMKSNSITDARFLFPFIALALAESCRKKLRRD